MRQQILKNPPIRFYGSFCLLFLCGFFVSACGSSKNPDAPTIFFGVFSPGAPVVPGTFNTIFLSSLKPNSNGFLTLDVNATGINGQFERVEFSIFFSGSVIQYEDSSAGDFFGAEDEVQYTIIPEFNCRSGREERQRFNHINSYGCPLFIKYWL